MRIALTMLGCLWLASPVRAVPQKVDDDEALAQKPLVVVARWTGKRPQVLHRKEKGVIRDSETRAEIEILEVLAGDAEKGVRIVLLRGYLGWDADGGPLTSFGPTVQVGETPDVTGAHLWFLEPGRSIDPADARAHPVVESHRGVQLRELWPYYEALRSRNRGVAFRDVLQNANPASRLRALRFLNGGGAPWPLGPATRLHPLAPKLQDTLGELLRAGPEEVRPEAAGILAGLLGSRGATFLRPLLEAKDPRLRAVALAWLSRTQKGEDLRALNAAASGIRDPVLGCRIVDALAATQSFAVVPGLISFLEVDTFGGFAGDEALIPALRAHAALKARVAFDFPFHTRESLRAWARVRKEKPEERLRLLKLRLKERTTPLQAKLVRDFGGGTVVVTNVSTKPVHIPRRPLWASAWTKQMSFAARMHDDELKKSYFIQLKPKQKHRFAIRLHKDFFAAPKEERGVRILYGRLGLPQRVRAYMGFLRVDTDNPGKPKLLDKNLGDKPPKDPPG